MHKNQKSKIKYCIAGYAVGFILCLAAMTFENYFHAILIQDSLTDFNHFVIPGLLGIFSAIFAYLFWNRKVKQMESMIQMTNNLRAHLEINKAFISSIDLDTVLQIIIDESTKLIQLDTGAIYLHEDEKLYLGATTPPLPDQFPEALRIDLLSNHPHIMQSLMLKEPVAITDTSTATLSEAEKNVVKIRNLLSILFIPLVIESRPVGTMILGSVKSIRTFSKNEIDLYNTFSSQAALAIENARLFRKNIIIMNDLRQQNEKFLQLNNQLTENNLKIQQFMEDLKIAKEKAEESDRLKTAFLNNISHEIRTPLNAIIGFSHMFASHEKNSSKLDKFSAIITESGNNLLNIISDVIEVSEIQSNQIKKNIKEFDFIQLIDEIKNEYVLKSNNKDIDFSILIQPECPTMIIKSDRNKLFKIIKHLVDNALKFTAKGSIKLNFLCAFNAIDFSISDTGIGIPEEMQNIIFEPFRQIETGNSRSFGGTGLGLALVKGYTELLGGKFFVESALNKGTTIKVTIPFQNDIKFETKKSNGIPASLKINTVLIVEDEMSNYEFLKEITGKFCETILYASNGEQAVEICKNIRQVDLILMDIKMPEMDGYTATKLIKAFRPDLPIIAQTAYAMESDIDKLSDCGFDDYICKPISTYELYEKMHKYTK